MWNDTNELIYKGSKLADFEDKLWLPKGINQEFGINTYTLYSSVKFSRSVVSDSL